MIATMSRIVALILMAVALAPDSRAESLDSVLDAMIEAYGGERVLRGADSMLQEWQLVALAGNRHGSDRRSIRIPGRLKVELTYPHKTEVRLLNGDDAVVVLGGSGPRQAARPQRDAMRLQLMRLYSPLALRERIGLMQMAGADGHWVLVLNESGLRAEYFVNRETLTIEKVVGYLSVGGGEMTFVTEYSDFAVMNGILVHRRENKFAGNTNTAVLQLRSISFDVKFAAGDFDALTERLEENVTIARN